MDTKITITNSAAQKVVIDIEGVIGVPETWQFEEPEQRTATYEKFRSQAAQIAGLKAAEVVVNIRSTGGDVNDALLIHDSLRSLSGSVTTCCYGYVASAATIIAQAASPNRREISANALYLIHNSVCTTEGNVAEMAKTVALLSTTDQTIATLYATRSGRPIEKFTQLMNENNGNGRWLSPSEALEEGLVDRIVGASPISNDVARQISEMGLPPLPQTKNNAGMNITKRWRAIMEALGLAAESENPLTESVLDKIDNSLSTSEIQLGELRNKVQTLEAQNAKLSAVATATKPKEDPSASERKVSVNESAYSEDVKKFKI